MSIRNLTTNNNFNANLNIESILVNQADITDLNANNVISFNTEIDQLYVSNVNAKFPDNDINLNNNLICNGNNIMSVNEISTDIINATEQLFIRNSTQIASNDQIHISDTVNASIWLEADTDNIGESDFAFVTLTEDGNNTMHLISGANNMLNITSGSNAGLQGINLRNATVIGSSQGVKPTFSNISTGLNLISTSLNIFRPTNFHNNNINNVGTFKFQTQPTLNNTANKILTLNNIDNTIEHREISSLSPFNQNLNTTDNVTFNNIEVNSISTDGFSVDVNNNLDIKDNNIFNCATMTLQAIGGLTTGLCLYFENNGEFVSVEPGCQLRSSDIISDKYRLNNAYSHVASYSLTRSLSANNDTILTNWNVLQTSPYINIDPVTGIFTPEQGIYCMTYNHLSDHSGSTAYIGVRLTLFPSNQTVYSSIQDSNNLFQPETGFEASQYECLTGYFDGINQYRLNAKMNANSSVSVFNVTITRLF